LQLPFFLVVAFFFSGFFLAVFFLAGMLTFLPRPPGLPGGGLLRALTGT
jgi:hypothetical protein